MPRDLPDFYYDVQKGKYFRIQPNHRAPTGAAYSRQNVNAERRSDKLDRQRKAHLRQKSTGLISRSRILESSVISLRLGASPQANRNWITRIYAQSLSHRPVLTYNVTGHFLQAFTFSLAGQLFVASSSNTLTTRDLRLDQPYAKDYHEHLWSTALAFELMHGPMACVNDHILVQCTNHKFFTRNISPEGILDTENAIAVRIGEKSMIWDVATAPDSNRWALAGTFGIRICDCAEVIGSSASLREQMTLSFKDHNTVVSGERSGRVNLTDCRSHDSVVRLLHSSGVNGLQCLENPNHILVSGLSSISIYDLRFSKAVDRKKRSTHKSARSTPLLTFAVPPDRISDHYPSSQTKSTFYSASTNILGVLSTMSPDVLSVPSSIHRITLYSTTTGRVIDCALTNKQFTAPVTSIQMCRVRDGPESLFILEGGELGEWWVHGEQQEHADAKETGEKVELGMREKWQRGDLGP